MRQQARRKARLEAQAKVSLLFLYLLVLAQAKVSLFLLYFSNYLAFLIPVMHHLPVVVVKENVRIFLGLILQLLTFAETFCHF